MWAGGTYTNKKLESWKKLGHLSGTSELPCLIIGEFIEITNISEKEGGSDRPRQ